MGTRHLITIVEDNEFKLAQYGQWDGMPVHQGSKILAALKKHDIDALRQGTDLLFYCTDKETDLLQQKAGVPAMQDWLNSAESDRIKELFPTIHRDTGAKIFNILAEGVSGADHQLPGREGLIPTCNSISFAGAWGCEWVYTVDLDTGLFETYRGGQDEELERTRFTEIVRETYEGSHEDPAFLHLVGSFSLDDLPTREDFRIATDPEGTKRYLDYLAQSEIEEEPEYPQPLDADNDDGVPSLSI